MRDETTPDNFPTSDLPTLAAELTDLTSPVGEIIEASTLGFLAQCPASRLNMPPVFGAFVRVLPPGIRPEQTAPTPADPFAELPEFPNLIDHTLYAAISVAETVSQEPGRRASAFGLEEEQLRAEQPHIFELLCTRFTALHIGYVERGRLRFRLPPRPPRLHGFVYPCSDAETCLLTESPDLLRTLLHTAGDAPVDELIAACLRHAYQCRGENFDFLVQAGRHLATLLRDDPDRLTALLRKLEP